MASVSMAPTSWRGETSGVNMLPMGINNMKTRDEKEMEATVADGKETGGNNADDVNKLLKGINNLKIRDEKEMEATVALGTETEDIIRTFVGGREVRKFAAKRFLGLGPFRIVFQARCLHTDATFAIKKVLQDERYENHELQTLRLLDHPNVVSLEHYYYSRSENGERYLNLVLEYVPETLHRVIKHYNERMPMIYIKLYAYQIYRALAYIHNSVGICHGDIKPRNILVNPYTHELKLCDFASVSVTEEPNKISYIGSRYVGSRYYRAPELMHGATEYTSASDIWSAGCVLAELILGHRLFVGESEEDQLDEISKVLGHPTQQEIKCMENPNWTESKFPQVRHHRLHKILPQEAVDLVAANLQYSPNLRSTALEALTNSFFDDLRGPSSRLPNGEPLPQLFNFKHLELKGMTKEIFEKLVPKHAREQFDNVEQD